MTSCSWCQPSKLANNQGVGVLCSLPYTVVANANKTLEKKKTATLAAKHWNFTNVLNIERHGWNCYKTDKPKPITIYTAVVYKTDFRSGLKHCNMLTDRYCKRNVTYANNILKNKQYSKNTCKAHPPARWYLAAELERKSNASNGGVHTKITQQQQSTDFTIVTRW